MLYKFSCRVGKLTISVNGREVTLSRDGKTFSAQVSKELLEMSKKNRNIIAFPLSFEEQVMYFQKNGLPKSNLSDFSDKEIFAEAEKRKCPKEAIPEDDFGPVAVSINEPEFAFPIEPLVVVIESNEIIPNEEIEIEKSENESDVKDAIADPINAEVKKTWSRKKKSL